MEIKSAEFVISNTRIDRCPQTGLPEYAFIGRSNVGKSSLINMLTGHNKLAMTSAKPGKTLLINHFIVNNEWYLVDLPGYGYAKVSHDEKIRWSELMESYFASGRDIRVVVQLIDMRHKPSEQDLDMIEYMVANKLPFIVALTKADKLNKTERMNCLTEICSVLAKYGNIPVVPFSSTKGDGVEELRGLISKYVEGE